MYAQGICSGNAWERIAQCLFASAEKIETEINLLWENMQESLFRPNEERLPPAPFYAHELQRVYLMLIAYCVENLCKGHIVKANRGNMIEEAKRSGRLPRILQSHDLEGLSTKCALTLNVDDLRLLERLSTHASWIGRYPYPLRADQFYSFLDGNPIPTNGFWWSSTEVHETKAVVEKIANQLKMALRPEH